jgi:hypothetical protein
VRKAATCRRTCNRAASSQRIGLLGKNGNGSHERHLVFSPATQAVFWIGWTSQVVSTMAEWHGGSGMRSVCARLRWFPSGERETIAHEDVGRDACQRLSLANGKHPAGRRCFIARVKPRQSSKAPQNDKTGKNSSVEGISKRENGTPEGHSRPLPVRQDGRYRIALSEMSLRHQAPDQRMHLTAR